MAKPPNKAQVNVRLPLDLIEWIATQAGSQTDVIAGALRHLRDGPVLLDGDAATWKERAEKAEAEVKRVRALSVDRTIQAVASKAIGRHASGPMIEPTGLAVAGMARGFNLRGKAGKSG